MADDPVDRGLEQIAGNRTLAHELRRNLEILRDQCGGSTLTALAATSLMVGSTCGTSSRSSTFAAPLTEAMDRFHEYDSRLSEDEHAELLEQAQRRLADNER